jgi:cobalt-zinc-cadmium efflux system protein
MSDHHRARTANRRRLGRVFALVVVFMLVEAGAGLLTGSLALLSDAGHMATDALGLGMALAAMVAATRTGAGTHRTFGLYRLEILAALANAVLLAGVAVYVIVESIQRIARPEPILAGPMLAVASAGLVVNVVGYAALRRGASESLNVEGALLEVVADLLGSVGAVVAAVVVLATGWTQADPLVGAAIGLYILPRAWRLGSRASRVLVQAAPPDLDMGEVKASLTGIEGVVDVHDLHVWTLTSSMNVASAHVMTTTDTDPHAVLDQAREALSERFAISHATIQVEPTTHEGCAEMSW